MAMSKEKKNGEGNDDTKEQNYDDEEAQINTSEDVQTKKERPYSPRRDNRKSEWEPIELDDLVREKIYAKHWNETSNDLLERWSNQCKNQVEMHNNAASNKRRYHRYMVVPSIVASGFAAIMSFYSIGSDCDEQETVSASKLATQICASLLTTSASVLISMTSVFNYGEQSADHVATSALYTNLDKEIKLQLSLPLERKGDVEVVLTSISEQLAHITIAAPPI
jgi:hypothetical protein